MTHCMLSELDLFSKRALQTSIVEQKENVYLPLTAIENNSTTILFHIPASADEYVDLNSIALKLSVQLLDKDGKQIQEAKTGTEVTSNHVYSQDAFKNNILHTIFKNIRVSANGVVISDTQLYHYKALIDTLLNYSPEQEDSVLAPQGFAKDTAENMEVTDFSTKEKAGVNKGFTKRQELTANSKTLELYGRLNIDVFNVAKLLLPQVALDFSCNLNSAPVVIYGKNEATYKIHNCSMYVRSVKLSTALLLYHHQLLNKNNVCMYPYKRSDLRHFTIVKGISTVEIPNVITGRLPSNFLMCLIKNESFVGNRTKNLYNFETFDIKRVIFNINGSPLSPSPLEIANTGYSRTYAEFLKATNAYYTDRTPMISLNDYNKGYFIVPCNLNLRQNYEAECEDLPKEGTLSISLTFGTPLPDAVTVLIYSEFYEYMKIDKNFNVSI